MSLTLALGGLAPVVLAAPAPKSNATLPDIEDEVMCTICGTTLQLSNSPQADRERAFIDELIAEGENKDQIKSALVDEYGSEVLAVPSTNGFDLTAWVVPIVAVIAALIAIALAARRWRRSPSSDGGAESRSEAIDPEDAERLRADLGRYEL